jgi:hypothetical protein
VGGDALYAEVVSYEIQSEMCASESGPRKQKEDEEGSYRHLQKVCRLANFHTDQNVFFLLFRSRANCSHSRVQLFVFASRIRGNMNSYSLRSDSQLSYNIRGRYSGGDIGNY